MICRSAVAFAIACTCPLIFGLTASVANAQEGIGTVRVASGLNRPIGLAHAPGDEDRLFIFEKRGVIKILDLNTENVLATPFLDISSIVVTANSQGDERGLLGMAFHPEYATNGYFYVKYFTSGGGAAGRTVVARYTVSGNPNVANPASALQILSINQPFSNHNGGWMDFGPDGYLYIASGDGGSGGDPQNHGQTTTTLLGAMLRIDVDNPGGGQNYGIPADNPFVGLAGSDLIWSYGLRNPWRNSFDRVTGDLYIADVGQFSWEEVNVQPANSEGGENYGWRCYEGNAVFNSSGCAPAGTMTFPVHVYALGSGRCAITGGYVYRGQDIPTWDGTYFFADYCSANIWSFSYNDGDISSVVNRTALLSPSLDGHTVSAITSFGEDARGEMYIVSQPFTASAGAVFKIVSTSPANNSCENAIAVTDGATNYSNTGATTTGPDEPDDCLFFGDSNIQADVWFSYTATCTGMLTVDLCNSTFASKLGIYGANCPTGSGELIACNAAACGTRASLTIPVTENEQLLFRVGGHNGGTGSGVMDISCDPVASCPGDLDGNSVVNVGDMLQLLQAWGPCPGCPEDIDGNGTVNVGDLLLLLQAWGPCN